MASLSTRWAKKSVTDLTAYRGEGLTVSTFGKGKKMVGTAGFEPATTTPPVVRYQTALRPERREVYGYSMR